MASSFDSQWVDRISNSRHTIAVACARVVAESLKDMTFISHLLLACRAVYC
jgi:hypothetical protein